MGTALGTAAEAHSVVSTRENGTCSGRDPALELHAAVWAWLVFLRVGSGDVQAWKVHRRVRF